MNKRKYSIEIKWAVIKEKLAGTLSTHEIMEKYGIKNKSQVGTWLRWYHNNEIYRLDQPIGKQYTYGFGPEGHTQEENLNRQMTHLKMENEILKKYINLERELSQK